MSKLKEFSIEEVSDMLHQIRERERPFYGEITLVWQEGKIVLWRESGTKKPDGTTGVKRQKVPCSNIQ